MKCIAIYLYVSGAFFFISFICEAELNEQIKKTTYLSKVIISPLWPLFPIALTIKAIYNKIK